VLGQVVAAPRAPTVSIVYVPSFPAWQIVTLSFAVVPPPSGPWPQGRPGCSDEVGAVASEQAVRLKAAAAAASVVRVVRDIVHLRW
jgi:hypothetical protein